MTAETHLIDREMVMAYLDGELTADDASRVAVHLEQCRACGELAAELRGVASTMLAWSVEPSPKRLSDAIFEELNKAGERNNDPSANRPHLQLRAWQSAWKRIVHNRWAWGGAGAFVVAACFLAITIQRTAVKEAAGPQRLALAYLPESSQEKLRSQLDSSLDNYRSPNQLSTEAGGLPQPAPVPPPNAPAVETGPLVARTATLNISVRDFSAARASVERIVKAHRGYLSSLNLSTERGSPQTLEAKLAIPAAECDAALADLRGLGRVAQEQQSSEEVSSQAVDLDARLKNARETEAQLAEILRVRAGKVGDVLDVEREMARVRGEIETMEADQKSLRARIAFATIDLNLSEEYQAQLGDTPSGARRQLWNALVDGYRAAADGLLKASALVLNAGPSLLLWGLILFWPARWGWRRWREPRSAARRADYPKAHKSE